MQTAPPRDNETATLAALHALQVLDSGPEAEFDALVHAASALCGVPISLISLIDADRQWFKANVGAPGVTETPRDLALCAHAVLGDDVFEVPDATQDPRFADNPLVSGAPDIRFYAGAPVSLSNGLRVGTLCVIDRQPRHLDDTQRAVLRHLAMAASRALEGRLAIRLREQAAADVARANERAALATESGGIGIWDWDIAAGVLRWDASMYRLYGMAPRIEAGGPELWTRHLHPDDLAPAQQAIEDIIQTGKAYEGEFRVVLADGSIRHMRAAGRATLDASGRALRMVGANWDITHLKRATEAVERANRAQLEFAATITHELRTPLQSIIGYSELGQVFAAAQPQFHGLFGDIQSSGQRMLRLVNGLLDISKIDGTESALLLHRGDLARLTAEVVVELRLLAGGRDVRIELPDPLPPLPADVDDFRIKQVMRNVLANAIRFAPPGTAVEVGCRDHAAPGVEVSVRDHGPGIPLQELESIFEPFVQSSRTRDGSGVTGLGLTICRKIMIGHAGSIVAANAESGGAVMCIRLPASVQAAVPCLEPA